jgi:hypothetical protein
MNCTLWFAFYCILLSAFVGWYSEYTETHCMRDVKNKAVVVWNYKTGFWCRYVNGPKHCGISVWEARVSPCRNSIKNVRVPAYTYIYNHAYRIAKLDNWNPQLVKSSCILILSLLLTCLLFCFHGTTIPGGQGPHHYRGFTITLRHTTLGRTPWTTDRLVAETSTW